MATRLLHLVRNGWVQRTRRSSYKALIPGGIGLFKSLDNTQIPSRQYPPSLNRTALLAGKLAKLTNHPGLDTAEKVVRDPVRMVMKSTTASKRETRRESLKARLVFGERFIKDVAETVSAKNDTSLSVRLKRAFADYGKVAVVFHSGVMALTVGACYATLKFGLDAQHLVALLPAAVASRLDPEAGTLVASLLLAECTAPPRYGLTIVAAPILGERLRGTRIGTLLGLGPGRPLRLSYLPGRGGPRTYLDAGPYAALPGP